jgi:DNA replication initiation complex subunit (GINS family)
VDLGRLRGRFRDILESRVGKIIRLSSAEATVQTRELQKEESTIYKELHELISTWRKELRKLGEA